MSLKWEIYFLTIILKYSFEYLTQNIVLIYILCENSLKFKIYSFFNLLYFYNFIYYLLKYDI